MPESDPTNKPDSPTSTLTVKQRLLFALRFVAGPLLFFAAGLALLAIVGVAQRTGWISSGGSSDPAENTSTVADVDYICPMMCTPPQKEPGRCPVCAMELVPASGGSAGGDERSVVVDPATRRVANIQTASVQRMAMNRTVRAVGEVSYDEGKMKTISAYTNGRFDKMYVDYTGAVVRKGDRLAEFYSPDLYSAQVEFLQAGDAVSRSGSIQAVVKANKQLRASSKQKLIEFGLSDDQINRLDRDRKPLNRLDVVAPIHGTVIERLAVEGEYVKEGQPIFRLADLSTVWLLLELFPNDASSIRYGQSVEAQLKSLPNRTFSGRIAFVDPEVDKQSRTVSIRVVLDNADGQIRIGDYAKATIDVPIGRDKAQLIYDPELANKWMSPRHPHVLSDAPGKCRICGIDMVPATELGFTDKPSGNDTGFVVPRIAVLSAADQSVVYVETETGRFEIRRVITGPTIGDNIVIVKGVAEGEKVATSGNFLLDSQMQLAGNPSLIDPFRATAPMEMIAGFSMKELAEIQQLSEAEQPLAIEQVICPVSEYKLGSMGVPLRVDVDGATIFICCEACREDVVSRPEVQLAKLESYKANGPSAAGQDDAFEVPEIGEIHAIDSDDSLEMPTIEILESSEGSFEIDVPDFDPSNAVESQGSER